MVSIIMAHTSYGFIFAAKHPSSLDLLFFKLIKKSSALAHGCDLLHLLEGT